MPQIHATAIVDPKAELAANVVIGPYSIIGPDVKIHDHVQVASHVVIGGRTTIGEKCQIFPFASIGMQPQDLKYHGEPSTLEIGSHCMIREHATLNPGTEGGGMVTRMGDHCLMMVGSHVAHDCQVGNHVILANNATLAGHVTVGDFAILGGLSAVRQFARIGAYAMVGGMSGVENDVIPFGMVVGNRARLMGLNVVGLKRRNFTKEEIQTLRQAYKELFIADDRVFAERVKEVEQNLSSNAAVKMILEFIKSDSSLPLCQPALNQEPMAA